MPQGRYKRQITHRLADGFYMYRLVPGKSKEGSNKSHSGTSTQTPPIIHDDARSSPPQLNEIKRRSDPQTVQTPPVLPRHPIETPNPQPSPSPVEARPDPVDVRSIQSDPPDCKGAQFPTPKQISTLPLSKQLEKEAAKKARRRKRKERKRKRKRSPHKKSKRTKVVTRYPEVCIPPFPGDIMTEEIHAEFRKTEAASSAREEPKTAFLTLTQLLVDQRKRQIAKVYKKTGVFGIVHDRACGFLDVLVDTITRRLGSVDIRFTKSLEPLPRESELANGIYHLQQNRKAVVKWKEAMERLREAQKDGSLLARIREKLDSVSPLDTEDTDPHEASRNAEIVKDYNVGSITVDRQMEKSSGLALVPDTELVRRAEQRRDFYKRFVARKSSNAALPYFPSTRTPFSILKRHKNALQCLRTAKR